MNKVYTIKVVYAQSIDDIPSVHRIDLEDY